MRKIWTAIVKLFGWKFELPDQTQRPEVQRCIFVVAPHTSVLDYMVGTAYLWELDVNGKIFIKKEFFRWPIGGILRRYGAISIDRGNRHNGMVEQAVAEFAKGGKLGLTITPEGTRKPTRRWKRGFWEIAHRAQVPIIPACIDFKHRRIWLEEAIYTTDNAEADIARVRAVFKKEWARHPENYIEYSPETPASQPKAN